MHNCVCSRKQRIVTWTYSGSPSISAIDMVHFRLGDTNPGNPISTDEECAQALADNHGNTWLAAADLAENKALEFLWRPTTVRKADGSSVSYADQAAAFQALAQRLRQNASVRTTTIYAGGLSVGEKQAARADTGLVQPFARKDLHVGPPIRTAATETFDPRED